MTVQEEIESITRAAGAWMSVPGIVGRFRHAWPDEAVRTAFENLVRAGQLLQQRIDARMMVRWAGGPALPAPASPARTQCAASGRNRS